MLSKNILSVKLLNPVNNFLAYKHFKIVCVWDNEYSEEWGRKIMYVSKPPSRNRINLSELSAPPEASNSGFLVVRDRE